MSVDNGGHGVGGIMKSIHELKSERNQQSDAQKHKGQDGLVVHEGKIMKQAGAGVPNSNHQHDAENQHAQFARRAGKFLVEYAWRCGRGCHGCSSDRIKIAELPKAALYGIIVTAV